MTTKKFTLKRDAYREARGGYARFLTLYCTACQSPLLLYQKDGPGTLYRLYLDRIFAPESLTHLDTIAELAQIPDLVCAVCGAVIGTPYIWEEENRKSFLLKQDAFSKKVSKGIYPPVKV